MAMGVTHVTVEAHNAELTGTTISIGQLVNVGAELSDIVTLKLQAALLPVLSVIVYLTWLVPVLKKTPLASLFPLAEVDPEMRYTTVNTEQLSEGFRGEMPFTIAPHVPASVGRIILPGQFIWGFSLSITVTLKLQFCEFPLLSDTLYVIKFTPIAKAEPLGNPLL